MRNIPEIVLTELERVRSSGVTNMLDRNTVIAHVNDQVAIDWLLDNRDGYMEALQEMGSRRTKN